MSFRSVMSVPCRRAGPALVMLAALAGCVPPGLPGSSPYAALPARTGLADRLLAASEAAGLPPPSFDQVLAQGEAGPLPVFRVRFPGVVFFDTAVDVPRPESRPILDVVAAELRDRRPDAFLTVVGHTDAAGSDGYNMDLSRRRADGVAAVLAADGVRPGQVRTLAVGRRQPLGDDATAEGRAVNRRVEFLFALSAAATTAAAVGPDEVASAAPAPRMAVTDEPAPLQPGPAARVASRPAPPRARPLLPGASPRTLEPVPNYAPNALETFQPRTLGPTQPF